MNKTQWYGGPDGLTLMPIDTVSTGFISVEHECPSPTPTNGYVDTNFQKVFNTKLKFTSSSLKVYINMQQLDDYYIERLTYQSFRINTGAMGYITISYYPSEKNEFYGGLDMLRDLAMSTNVYMRYIRLSIRIIDQIRYAINKMEKEIDYPQTRWSGGVFSDEFGVAKLDSIDLITRSNLVDGSTEIMAQHLYEMQNAVEALARNKSISIVPYAGNIYSYMGIHYDIIEWLRRTINRMEPML